MEFKGTKGEWKIVEKGNTVKQLCIQVDEDNKVCGNISPKRMEDALLIASAPEMLEMLEKDIKYLEEIAMLIPSELLTEEFRDKWNKEMTSKEQLIKKATEL